VTSEDDAITSLQASGLLDVLTWAAPVAFARTGNDYDEDAGHDQAIVGQHNFVYLRDLLDRSTSNGRYELSDDATNTGADMLGRGISARALETMPVLARNAIARNDYRRSPGWAADGYRVLLQSYKYGSIDHIKWGQRSKAKKRVATQQFVSGVTLFADEDFGLESLPGIPDDDDFNGLTLVAAHSYDPITGKFEFFIGQSKNPEFRGDGCWHWRRMLLSGGADGDALLVDTPPVLPGASPSGDAAEIPVRLRRPLEGQGRDASNG
jgi:hypothetical protein